ncbi:putative two-component sensor [Planoprotostelium fungivorum]|uniref:histidine kinase n=1 Tax=Planoprotostelium fungivorum TaxID=1890364 RepID=A0A2P6NUR6_9EUKA|nr:putative two-component sensor [Planoprotostelium fungivorum]
MSRTLGGSRQGPLDDILDIQPLSPPPILPSSKHRPFSISGTTQQQYLFVFNFLWGEVDENSYFEIWEICYGNGGKKGNKKRENNSLTAELEELGCGHSRDSMNHEDTQWSPGMIRPLKTQESSRSNKILTYATDKGHKNRMKSKVMVNALGNRRFASETLRVITGWKFVTIFGLSLLVVGVISLSLTLRFEFFRYMAAISSFILCFLIFAVFCLSQMTWSDGFFMSVGLGYGFVGFNLLLSRGLNLIKQMPASNVANRQIQLVETATLLEIVSLYIGILLAQRTFRGWIPTFVSFSFYFILQMFLMLLVFYWNVWPMAADTSGNTYDSYNTMNYIWIALFAVLWLLLVYRRRSFSVDVFVYLIFGVLLRLCQLAFASQVSEISVGPIYVISSLLRVLSYTYLFLSVGVTTLRNPMETLYRNLTMKQNALQNEKVLVSWMIEQVPAIAILLDKNGILCHINSYAHNAFGTTSSSMVHASFFEFFVFEDASASILQFDNLIASNDPNNFITLKSISTQTEENRIIEWTVKMVKSSKRESSSSDMANDKDFEMQTFLRRRPRRSNDKKDQIQILCLGKDVTDKSERVRLLTEARNNAERLSLMKDTFVANVSHELRTPLNCIVGVTDLIQHSSLTETQKGMVSMIKTAANSLLSLISDLLDFAKLNDGQLKLVYSPFDLRAFVEDSLQSLSVLYQNNLDFGYRVTKDCPKLIENDVNRLRQVLFNLMSNAIKFTPKGQILVLISMVEATVDTPTPMILFSVRDSGVGVKPADLKMLFERFFQASDQGQARKPGTGIGLAITKQFVELMGGKIHVESEYGVGTTVSFQIPTMNPHPRAPAISEASESSIERSRSSQMVVPSQNSFNIPATPQLGEDSEQESSASYGTPMTESVNSMSSIHQKHSQMVWMCHENEVITRLFGESLQDDYGYRCAFFYQPSQLARSLDQMIDTPDVDRPSILSIVVRPSFLEFSGIQEQLHKLTKQSLFVQIIILLANSTASLPSNLSAMEEQFRVETLPKTIPISILLRMLRRGAKKLPPINRQKSSSIHAITEMAPTEQSRAENLGDVTPVHVLVVEDNKTNQKVMQLMMDKVGAVTYQMAENGQEAIDRFLENPKGFDCILMDCQMPVMDGVTATQQIRKIEAGRPDLGRTHIAALTANALQEEKDKCLSVGMDDYITKPITFLTFQSKIESLRSKKISSS